MKITKDKVSLIKEFDWFEYIKSMDLDELSEFLRLVWNQDANIFPDVCSETDSVCYGDCTENNKCIKEFLKLPCEYRYKVTFVYVDDDFGELSATSEIPFADLESLKREFTKNFGDFANFDKCKSIKVVDRRDSGKGSILI